jgi:hypothetical protein
MIQGDQTMAGAAVRWTLLVLHFADGSGLVSTWDEARGCAVQRDGPRHMPEPSATAEHLRALAELRDTGGCTNWIARTTVGELDPPALDAIDWSGFEAPDPEQ